MLSGGLFMHTCWYLTKWSEQLELSFHGSCKSSLKRPHTLYSYYNCTICWKYTWGAASEALTRHINEHVIRGTETQNNATLTKKKRRHKNLCISFGDIFCVVYLEFNLLKICFSGMRCRRHWIKYLQLSMSPREPVLKVYIVALVRHSTVHP